MEEHADSAYVKAPISKLTEFKFERTLAEMCPPQADFEGVFHSNSIPSSVISKISSEPRILPFDVTWYWDVNGVEIVSVTHRGRIIYDEYRRNDTSPDVVTNTRSLIGHFDFGGTVQGGRFEAECTVHFRNLQNGQLGESPVGKVLHSIRGDNPSSAAIKARLPDLRMKVIAYLESRFRQFDNTGLPLFGPPNGFGVMQLDNPVPSARQLWDWKSNIDGGITLFRTKEREVTNHFRNIYAKYPDAPHLTAEQISLSLYQYYNGGFYWDWDVATRSWKKVGKTSYGDCALSIERNVTQGKPPKDWD